MGRAKKKIEFSFAEPPLPPVKDELLIEGCRQNNLKNISLSIPHDRITAIVGPSGSGKSSLAFDTLFAEGRWRYMESLSTYTRLFLERMARPLVDRIYNIRPAISIEQKNPVRTSRSTVGTATEVNDYLRVLFARLGRLHCPGCKKEVTPQDTTRVVYRLLKEYRGRRLHIGFSIPVDGDGSAIEALIDELLKKGFVRIRTSRVIDISYEEPPIEEIRRLGTIDVVVDRLITREDTKQRLTDSVETAFRDGRDNMWVWVDEERPLKFSRLLRCTRCSIELETPSPILFSFNHPVGACPECKGFGNILKYDEDKIVPDKSLTLREGAIEPWTKPAYRWWQEELERYADRYHIDLDRRFYELSEREKELLFRGTEDFEGVEEFFEYLESKRYKLHIRVFLSRYKGHFRCPACRGTRLKEKALLVTIGGLNIAEINHLTVSEARRFFKTLELTPVEREIAKEALKQINLKLDFLEETGLGYITLDRLTRTLSGGEAQRVALANQLASSLSGVLYILDEPSIGLHPRDVAMLTAQLKRLSGLGNTVVIVEHDQSIIKESHHIVELGPGSGEMGGRIVYNGHKKDFMEAATTLTARYLRGELKINVPRWRRKGSGKELIIRGAKGNNLKGIDVRFPLNTFICITGVSGSGKSSLVMDTLYNALALKFGIKADRPLPYHSMEGAEHLQDVRLMDQEPIGKTPRSNPITYMGGFDDIRHFFASLRPAREQGIGAGNFSFNVPGGRCEACKGEGMEKVEMYFLPDVYIDCSACNGRRYKPEILKIKHNNRNIYDVLQMTFDEAFRFFAPLPHLVKKLSLLREVGLGYLRLGQSALTLSGGEAQRLKIARELLGGEEGGVLYILDEPTTGLHPDDIKKLLAVLGRLVDAGNTVIVVEHNLDCMKTADHIIDLGPEGGERGGMVVAEGTPERIARTKQSHTGRYLKPVLRAG